jgi:hypothetical protein
VPFFERVPASSTVRARTIVVRDILFSSAVREGGAAMSTMNVSRREMVSVAGAFSADTGAAISSSATTVAVEVGKPTGGRVKSDGQIAVLDDRFSRTCPR